MLTVTQKASAPVFLKLEIWNWIPVVSAGVYAAEPFYG